MTSIWKTVRNRRVLTRNAIYQFLKHAPRAGLTPFLAEQALIPWVLLEDLNAVLSGTYRPKTKPRPKNGTQEPRSSTAEGRDTGPPEPLPGKKKSKEPEAQSIPAPEPQSIPAKTTQPKTPENSSRSPALPPASRA